MHDQEPKLTRKQLKEEQKALRIMRKEEKKQQENEASILEEQRRLVSKANQITFHKSPQTAIRKTKEDQALKELEDFLET